MRKKTKFLKRAVCAAAAAGVCFSLFGNVMFADDSIEEMNKKQQELRKEQQSLLKEQEDLQKQQEALKQEQESLNNKQEELKNTQNDLSEKEQGYNRQQDELTGKKESTQAEVDELEEQLRRLLAEIDELKKKEDELVIQIGQANHDLEAEEQKSEQQYKDMKLRIRYMYENQTSSIEESLMTSEDMSEFLNAADYYQKIYDYDRDKLEEIADTMRQIEELTVQLEERLAEVESTELALNAKQEEVATVVANKQDDISRISSQIAEAAQAAADAARERKEAEEESERLAAEAQSKYEEEQRVASAAKSKGEEAANLKAQADELAKKEAEARAKAKAEAEARAKAEAEAKAAAEAKAKAEAEARAKAKAEAEARAKAEAEAAAAKAEAERIAKAEADAKAKAEAEAKAAEAEAKAAQARAAEAAAAATADAVQDVDDSALESAYTSQRSVSSSNIGLGDVVARNARANNGWYPATYGMCARWVAGIYAQSGAGRPYGDAIDYWNKWSYTGGTSMYNIPVGAAVISSGAGAIASVYGHIGIYLGDGMVASNVGGVKVESIESFARWSTATCQGHRGFIGWVWPNGVALN